MFYLRDICCGIFTGISAGVLKVNTDSKGVYNKTEVTVKADIRLSCSNTQETENILIRPIYDNWDSDTLSPEIISNNADTPMPYFNFNIRMRQHRDICSTLFQLKLYMI